MLPLSHTLQCVGSTSAGTGSEDEEEEEDDEDEEDNEEDDEDEEEVEEEEDGKDDDEEEEDASVLEERGRTGGVDGGSEPGARGTGFFVGAFDSAFFFFFCGREDTSIAT